MPWLPPRAALPAAVGWRRLATPKLDTSRARPYTMTPPRAGFMLGHCRPHGTRMTDPEPGGIQHGAHSPRSSQGHRRPRSRRGRPGHARAPGIRPDHPKERAGLSAGRRYLEVRPALQHLLERHPGLLQYLRQPDEPAPRREALPRPRHRVEARWPDDLALQAAPGGQVPQWRPGH